MLNQFENIYYQDQAFFNLLIHLPTTRIIEMAYSSSNTLYLHHTLSKTLEASSQVFKLQ